MWVVLLQRAAWARIFSVAWACVDLRVTMVDIVSFPAQVPAASGVIATINANTTAGLIYALSTDEIAGQRNEALAS